MNKTIILISMAMAAVFINFSLSTKSRMASLKAQTLKQVITNASLRQSIKEKQALIRQAPIPLETAYGIVLNQIRMLESFSGTNMNVQLEGGMDTQDISSHFVGTIYRGIRGLKIKIVVDKFSKETDMGAVLDDIHTLEKNTDFMSTQITKDNNNLIVKGEIYGL